jgi:opacity protein-like surface antigen
MRKNWFLVLFVAIFSIALCNAQVSPDEQPPIDVFAGYSHSSNFHTGLNGWILSGNYTLGTSWVGVEGEFSGHYGTQNLSALPLLVPGTPLKITSNLYNYDFGPRVTWRSPKQPFNAFGHFLFGGSRAGLSAAGISDNDTSFSWVLGGGGDYNISPRWAGRAQLDLLHTNFFSNGGSHPRFSVGLVFRFGQPRE